MDNRNQLNAINVFPVADGDTGSNMGGTLGSIVEGILPSRETAIHRTLRSVADLALSGARGCSGTILAQFLHGLAEEFTDAARLTTRSFGLGVQRAVAYPYQAVSDPREGTILTVLNDWGEKVLEWSRKSDDFIEVLHHAYRAARASLAQTKEKLAVLARAGVVDAGAQGLVHLLAGITRFIAAGRIRELDPGSTRRSRGTPSRRWSRIRPSATARSSSSRAPTSTREPAPGARRPGRFAHRGRLGGPGEDPHPHRLSRQALRSVDRHGRVASQRVEDMSAQFRARSCRTGTSALSWTPPATCRRRSGRGTTSTWCPACCC